MTLATTTSIHDQINASIKKGSEFLANHQLESGEMQEPNSGLSTYYKTAQAFVSTGALDRASKLLDWVVASSLTEDGDFGRTDGRGQQAHNAVYPNAWLTLGAHRSGRYDVSYPAIRCVLANQNSTTGGFYRNPPGTNPSSVGQLSGTYGGGFVDGGQDILNSSMAGLACLAMGYKDEALKSARFVAKVLSLQPDPSDRVYFQMSPDGMLVVDFPEDQSAAFMLNSQKTDQNYFQIGIAAAFLCRMYVADSDKTHVEVAKQYIDLLDSYGTDKYAIGKSGKVGWGSAYLYRLTGEQRFKDIFQEVALNLMSLQGQDGSWVSDRSISAQVEVTSEFVTLLTEIKEGLSRS